MAWILRLISTVMFWRMVFRTGMAIVRALRGRRAVASAPPRTQLRFRR